uniref:Uncharacterized protein n=1 Tax=Arundo donax TaxID=35708 RepID=A0A0A8YF93_ARUDO
MVHLAKCLLNPPISGHARFSCSCHHPCS